MKIIISLALAAVLAVVATLLFFAETADEMTIVVMTGSAPDKYQGTSQGLTFYGCNNTTIKTNMIWGDETIIELPYGKQQDYFISKYYIASPPLPNTFAAGKPITLGRLYDDHFSITQADQTHSIFMDYTLLKPIALETMPISYNNADASQSCIAQDINAIPINIRCPSFQYKKQGVIGLGKGIAQISRAVLDKKTGKLADNGELFIPTDIETKQLLEGCTVEILNDINLTHNVYFKTTAGLAEKIDLTKAFKQYKEDKTSIGLSCQVRVENDFAAGCFPIAE